MKRPTNQKMLAVLALSLVSFSAMANPSLSDESALNTDPISVLNAPQLNVDGSYHQASESDLIRKQNEEMIRKNNDMVNKKVETMRMDNEKKLGHELSKMLGGQAPVADQVTTSQASTQKIEATTEAIKPVDTTERNFKVIPYAGASNMTGQGEVNFQSKVNTGLRVEALTLNRRLGIGVGFNYAQTDIRDNRYTFGYYGANYGQNAPEFKYKNMSGELYGKFFLLTDSIFRPYVGAGVGYNSSQLRNSMFSNNQTANYGLSNEYNSTFVTGAALVGTDLQFTNRFGINVEFKYQKAFTSSFNSNNIGVNPGFQGYDQVYLQQLGQQMDDAAVMAFNFGLVLAF